MARSGLMIVVAVLIESHTCQDVISVIIRALVLAGKHEMIPRHSPKITKIGSSG